MGVRARPLAIGLLVLSAAGVLSTTETQAQRQRVLKQIEVPHDYYYREMYLPQATSGPSAAAWSPDGRELVYSAQGYLWRQRVGSAVAEQITTGPGYDYQPDWSPDGRFVIYASYDRDAIDLKLLDLGTGQTTTLLANGAVNVEPRWSPDGRKLALVSTAFNGRWHVFIGRFDGTTLTNVERVTEDRDSQLPRYYYSRFDHYLSPSWSPDGAELLLVSNRGRIHGTGGFWRMAAQAGAELRPLHYEETTWRARPDWSRDGRRVVYASYAGREWHQLWLMTAEGGDIFPLTYGDFDATTPRWSPDGRRIAYISNEDGNTALWIVEIPGGRRTRVTASERKYRTAVGTLRVSVEDEATGRLVPARVSVVDAGGRGFAPDTAWRHADDGFERSERKFEFTYFHTVGESELTVPAGELTIEVQRGFEFAPVRQRARVTAGSRESVRVRLRRITDLAARGWRSGDLHVHMNYAGTYRSTPSTLAFQASAEALDVVENLIVNKEQRIPDVRYFSPKPDPVSTADRLIQHGQEFHTSVWGHLALVGLGSHLLLPDYAGYANTAAASLFPSNATVIDLAHEQGALAAYVHVFETEPNPGTPAEPLTNELPVDVALGKVDYLEVVGFADHRATAAVWYRLLNCGFRLPAGGGTDAMANFASLRGPVGTNRVYAKTGATLTHAAFLDAIRNGRTFATNGPLVELTVNGQEPGAEVKLPAGRHQVRLRGSLRSIVPVEHLEVISNGEVVASIPLEGDATAADFDRTLTIEKSGWVTLRAWSRGARHPVLDIYPFATTSPVYVIVGDTPVRSSRDAAYFVTWIDRLSDVAKANRDWNTDAERQTVLEQFAEAKKVFEDRMR